MPFWFPLIGVWLGSAYALGSRLADALPQPQQPDDQQAAIGLMGVHSLFLTLQGEAMLVAGRTDDAKSLGDQALAMARSFKERGHQAWALHLLADVEARREPPDVARAEAGYRDAIALATELGMRPLVARCHLDLGRFYRRAGRPEAAATLATARAQLEKMGMELRLKDAIP